MNYSVGALSRATGVPISTLRTWERRYGLPRPSRTEGGRRVYSEEDLSIVRRMQALHRAGLPAALAAESALADEAAPAEASVRPPLTPAAQELFDRAAAFDEPALNELIAAAVAEQGWGDALTQMLFPALVKVGRAWEEGELSLAQEHFLSNLI
jgi:DNA-binding transcriptional MerR regulator